MPTKTPVPPVDYTSKDWATFRDDMKDAISTRLPEWTSRSPNDFGIVLIELFAYVGDILSFYGDRIANEAFLPTAVLRSSVYSIAAMLDYRPTQNLAAEVALTLTIMPGAPVTIPAGTQVSTAPEAGEAPIIFETDSEIIIANTPPYQGNVTAIQGVSVVGEVVGQSNGTLDQTFSLYGSPVIDGSQVIYVNEGVGAVEWLFFSNLIDAGPADNAYTTFTDENGALNIQFGDNVNGRVPSNVATVTADYRVGGGLAGNVGAGKITNKISTITGWTAVTNSLDATGGADSETLDEIRENAPRSLTTIDRAVTTADYANLALKVAGVAKAKSQALVYTNVNLYIAPNAYGAVTPLADANTKTRVQAYIDARKMINATVTLLDPTYVNVNVTADVNVLPRYQRESVRLDVEKAIRTVLAYENSSFGDRVTISEIYKAINAITGVDYVVVSVLSLTGSGLTDVQLADNQIPTMGTVTVTATGGIVTT